MKLNFPRRLRNRPRLGIGLIGLAIYVGLHFLTTTVQPQGTGGLSGPLQVRVYASENHLAVFYPVHLMERWIRNGSLTFSDYRFGVDFQDQVYAHDWMYGDGKYGSVWYEDPKVALTFIFCSVNLSLLCWKLLHVPPWIAAGAGPLAGLLIVFAMFSADAEKMWAEECLSIRDRHGGGPVLRLEMVYPNGGGFSTATRSATSLSGGGGEVGKRMFWDEVIYISTNSFLIRFTLERHGLPTEKVIVVFPYDCVTETNWHDFKIKGHFL